MDLLKHIPYVGTDSLFCWVRDIVLEFKVSTDKVESVLSLIKSSGLKSRLDHDGDPSEKDQFSYHTPRLDTLVFNRIFAATLLIMTGDLALADEILALSNSVITNLNGDHKPIKLPLKSIQNSIKWCLLSLRQPVTNGNMKELKVDHARSDAIRNTTEYKAVAEALKASVMLALGIDDRHIIEKLRKASHLDPEYYMWHHYLYQILSQERKSNMGLTGNLTYPGSEEMNSCARSTILRSGVLLNMFAKCSLLFDQLWVKSRGFSKFGGDEYQWTVEDDCKLSECLTLLGQAEELASLHGLFSWKEHIKIMKANVLLLDRSRRDNFIRGEKLLQALPAEHESSDLSTKEMCKFLYLDTLELTWELNRRSKDAYAKLKDEVYKNPTNSEILLTYMEFLKIYRFSTESDHVEVLKMIRKSLEGNKGADCEALLEILQGCVIWLFNPEDLMGLKENSVACKIWIEAMVKFPNIKEQIYKMIQDPPFTGMLNAELEVNFLDLTIELDRMRRKLEMQETRDEERLQAVFNLWVMGEMELPSPPPKRIGTNVFITALERFSRDRKPENSTYVPPHQRTEPQRSGPRMLGSQRTLADSDKDWRRNPGA